jgi:phospholipase D1/2
MLGSAVGLLPGITGISIFTDQLAATIQKPDLPAFTALVAVAAVLIVITWACWRWVNRRRETMNASPVTQSD